MDSSPTGTQPQLTTFASRPNSRIIRPTLLNTKEDVQVQFRQNPLSVNGRGVTEYFPRQLISQNNARPRTLHEDIHWNSRRLGNFPEKNERGVQTEGYNSFLDRSTLPFDEWRDGVYPFPSQYITFTGAPLKKASCSMGISLSANVPWVFKIAGRNVHSWPLSVFICLLHMALLGLLAYDFVRTNGDYSIPSIIRWGICTLSTVLLASGLVAKKSWLLVPTMAVYTTVIVFLFSLLVFCDVVTLNNTIIPTNLPFLNATMVKRSTASYTADLSDFLHSNLIVSISGCFAGLLLLLPYCILKKTHHYFKTL